MINTPSALDIRVEIVHEDRVEQIATERAERSRQMGPDLLVGAGFSAADSDDQDAIRAAVNGRAQSVMSGAMTHRHRIRFRIRCA